MSDQATILVVDDTEAKCRLLGNLPGITGYRVVTASSGAEALALIRDQQPDLVGREDEQANAGVSGHPAAAQIVRGAT